MLYSGVSLYHMHAYMFTHSSGEKSRLGTVCRELNGVVLHTSTHVANIDAYVHMVCVVTVHPLSSRDTYSITQVTSP